MSKFQIDLDIVVYDEDIEDVETLLLSFELLTKDSAADVIEQIADAVKDSFTGEKVDHA